MSSNLFKSYYVNREEHDPRVIDTNDIIAKKLERIRMVLPMTQQEGETEDGFYDGLDAGQLDMLTTEDAAFNDEESISNVIKAEPQTPPEPVFEGPTPEELIEEAKQEIEAMRLEAKRDIAKEKEAVYEEARNQGYEEGKAEGRVEAAKLKESLEQERKRQETAYEEKVDELEPRFVRVLTDIYEKVFTVDLSADKNLIVALLHNSMKKIEGCKNFLVHVSRTDYPYVSEKKEKLLSDAAQEGTIVDVIEDASLKENECMIETPNGIFDCGLGTQLEQLKKRLMLLSYESDYKDR